MLRTPSPRRPCPPLSAVWASVALVTLSAHAQSAPPPPDEPLAESSGAPGAGPDAPPSAAPAAEPAPAYQPWHGTAHAPPAQDSSPLPPPVDVGAARYYRRPVELVPSLGVALPRCRPGTQSDDRCEGVGVGGLVGFTVLWRVTPYFAWGGGFELAGFSYDPPPQVGLHNPRSGAVWLGLKGRVYFNDEGVLDPYVQLGLGLGALGTTGDDDAGDTYEETGAGAAAQLGGGIDFHLSRGLRLGPRALYTRVFVDKIRRCRASGDGDCVDLSKSESGYLDGFITLGVGLTVMLGEEL